MNVKDAVHRNRFSIRVHGELVGLEGGGFWFGRDVYDYALQNEEFVGGAAAEFEVGAGNQADGSGEFAAGFVAAGVYDPTPLAGVEMNDLRRTMRERQTTNCTPSCLDDRRITHRKPRSVPESTGRGGGIPRPRHEPWGTGLPGFWWMIQSPDGRYGMLEAAVPGDDNAWMIENF